MRTPEEIKARKENLKRLYQSNKPRDDGRKMLVGAMRELDWVLGGDEDK